ncbi:MAG TPA: hypothetical protein EYP52_02015 [Anaerolineae bacterium]|nr:hypothetical protein [Anaerolineae bacterium]
MDKNVRKASEVLGEPVVAGASLESGKSLLKSVAFGLAGVVGKALVDVAVKNPSLPGDYEGLHYVAVGETKVGFFAMKPGLFRPSVGQLLVEHPRSAVRAVEIEKGLMPTVHFVFEDGTHYILKCPRAYLGKMKEVRQVLMGPYG